MLTKVQLSYVHPGQVSQVFMQSVLWAIQSSPDISLAIAGRGSGPLICRARNELVQFFLQGDADYFFSVDTDISFPPTTLPTLLSHNVPIVSAYYNGVGEDGKTFPVALNRNEEGMFNKVTAKDIRGRGLKKVDAIGMGCALVERAVMEKLGTGALWPFAEIINPETGQALGEDVTFCLRAKELGYDSYFDVDTRVEHLKPRLF